MTLQKPQHELVSAHTERNMRERYARTRNMRRSINFENAADAREVADEYVEQTGRPAEVQPCVGGSYCVVDSDDGSRVCRIRTVEYNFKNRSVITTEHEPINADAFVEGRFSADITEVLTYNDEHKNNNAPEWIIVHSGHPTGDGRIFLATQEGPMFVEKTFVVFGVVKR